ADTAVRDAAIAETDRRLRERPDSEKRAADRTVINNRRDPGRVRAPVEAFLAALEKDAKERAKRRKKNERLANALKEEGNVAFRKGDYSTAAQKYTDGLQKLKDMPELYTNRAQAYLRMHEYGKAIGDCEWALKCNAKCIKAYFLMGKAHLALKHYDESRECYQKLLQLDPQKESLFKDCMNEVNLEEKRMQEEDRAMKAFQSGEHAALSIKDLLQKLDRPDQNILYYMGGIQVLTGAIKECTEQTLFRTNNGFSIINDNKVIRRKCVVSESRSDGWDFITCDAVLRFPLFSEENQRLLLTHPDVNAQLLELLCSGVLEIQKETLALIALYSDNENGRRLLLVDQAALACCIGIMGNLCADATIRVQMAECSECWQACLQLVVRKFGVSLQQCFLPCSTGVLSRILAASSLAVEEAVKGGVVKKMIKFLKAGGQTTSSYAIKVLSICTRSSRQAQEEVVKSDKKFSVLLKLLDSESELIVGNAAFCLGQCLVVPGAATSLLNSNIVMALLKHAGGDAARTSVQENAAIALGKLCVAEPRHIFQLRELNGMAILNSSMKYVHSS
uniref:Tetratricopeptide repeat domain 12 n=1 Tax=Coturnix japonica TaxID=93934 RepID=A0A8C2TM75_COTJA